MQGGGGGMQPLRHKKAVERKERIKRGSRDETEKETELKRPKTFRIVLW